MKKTKKQKTVLNTNTAKNSHIQIRLTEKEKNDLMGKAHLYTGGNLSAWVLYAAQNYIPSKDELN